MGWCASVVRLLLLLLPRHVGKLLRWLHGRGFGLGHFQLRLAPRPGRRRGHVTAPRRDARLQSMMFGGFFVACLHVEEGQVGVDELFVWFECLRLVPLGDGAGEVALAVM